MTVGLNPHLINLMTIRERQRLHAPAATSRRAEGATGFTSALGESMATSPAAAAGEAEVLVAAGTARADAVRHMAQAGPDTVGPSLTAEKILSPRSLVSRFLGEQDLVLAAQRAPDSRYRNTPDDDTSGEAETQANLRPVD
ncbi:hypothetical protein CMK11_18895 [Candidatus Poribacteria bacterium]|nr:hypothetical protein [Candidatus Poribacteria bacterium]